MENTYSLFLIPTNKTYNKFTRIIFELSEKYNSPKFEPHVTLIGAIIGTEEELSNKVAQIAGLIKPLKIKLDRVDYFNEWHRALLIRTEKTTELVEANKTAREVFNLPPNPNHMSHLSLLYGDFNLETKKEIIKTLGRDFDDEFEVTDISLYFTTGKEENWHKIKDFPLS